MRDVHELEVRAREAESAGEYPRALGLYRSALETARSKDPDAPEVNPALHLRVADLEARLGRRRAALEAYREAVRAYRDRGLLPNAVAVCNKALRTFPGRSDLLLLLAGLQQDLGLEADARESLERALAAVGNEVSGKEGPGKEESGKEGLRNEGSGNEVSGNEGSGREELGKKGSASEARRQALPEVGGDVDDEIERTMRAFLEHQPDQEVALHLADLLVARERTGEAVELLRACWTELTARTRPAGRIEARLAELDPSVDPADGAGRPWRSGRPTWSPRTGVVGSGVEEPGVVGSGVEEPGVVGSGVEEPERAGSGVEEPADAGSETTGPGGAAPWMEGENGEPLFPERVPAPDRTARGRVEQVVEVDRSSEEIQIVRRYPGRHPSREVGTPEASAERNGRSGEDDAGAPRPPGTAGAPPVPEPPPAAGPPSGPRPRPDPGRGGDAGPAPGAGSRGGGSGPGPSDDLAGSAEAERDPERRALLQGLATLEELLEVAPDRPELHARRAVYARRLGDPTLLAKSFLGLGDALRDGGHDRAARLAYRAVAGRSDRLGRRARVELDGLDERDRCWRVAARTGDAEPEPPPAIGTDDRDVPGGEGGLAGAPSSYGGLASPEADRRLDALLEGALAASIREMTWLHGAVRAARTAGAGGSPALAYELAGRYLLARDRAEEAVGLLEEALARLEDGDPERRADLLFHLATACSQAGREGRARGYMDRVLELDEALRLALEAVGEREPGAGRTAGCHPGTGPGGPPPGVPGEGSGSRPGTGPDTTPDGDR